MIASGSISLGQGAHDSRVPRELAVVPLDPRSEMRVVPSYGLVHVHLARGPVPGVRRLARGIRYTQQWLQQ